MEKKDLKFGNVVKFKNGELALIHPIKNYTERGVLDTEYIKESEVMFRNIKTGSWSSKLSDYNEFLQENSHNDRYDIMEIYEDYTCTNLLWERPKELLTLDEKEYLKAVIKPFKDKVESVQRLIEYLVIDLEDSDGVVFPYYNNLGFEFRGLEYDKRYSLKELGLED